MDQRQSKKYFLSLYKTLYSTLNVPTFNPKWILLKKIIKDSILNDNLSNERKNQVFDLLILQMETAIICSKEIGLDNASIFAIMLFRSIKQDDLSIDKLEKEFGKDMIGIIRGMVKISEYLEVKSAYKSEHFIKLLFSSANDIRVVFIIIAYRLAQMRNAQHENEEYQLELAIETSYLYAPLSHRLGLYRIKSELEDLSLKYSNREDYDHIANKLRETKRERDYYIQKIIEPIKEKLDKTDITYEIKGRTKSIFSINNKLKNQNIDFEYVYDLFAIRIIIDAPEKREKFLCWQVYSIITDMYQPNPKRFKDWLSVPKSNGYESLHITIMGPLNRWVEVQIRSKRMDQIAERGLAAHWKYKGVKSEDLLDQLVSQLRESLENKTGDAINHLQEIKLDLYDEEIFVFSPKGDLFQLPKGATVLDFAFNIHTKLGCTCISGIVNGKNVPIKHILHSGDQVAINTSPNQVPKRDWLNFVKTARARNKIRQFLKEEENKAAELAKEMFQRRLKNRKLEMDEAILSMLVKKMKFKSALEFFSAIASGKLDINEVIDQYMKMLTVDEKATPEIESAETFKLNQSDSTTASWGDELVIDQNLTGIEYNLAKCCYPIYGDDIFAFVSHNGIKIHRVGCPNSQNLFSKYGYRIIKARWTGKSKDKSYPVMLYVVGNDQINIVANIMSIISKENGIQLRSINIDSTDGLFQGSLLVETNGNVALESLIKKLTTIKGVKKISRQN